MCSCCVDEVAAEHVGADCIVHYGSACLSPSRRLPLLYIFEQRALDVEKCASSFRELYPDRHSHIIILYDVNYAHAISKFAVTLKSLCDPSNYYVSTQIFVFRSVPSVHRYLPVYIFIFFLPQMVFWLYCHQSIQTLLHLKLLLKGSSVTVMGRLKDKMMTPLSLTKTMARSSISLDVSSP